MKHQLHTKININADVQTVWSIFSNFQNYPNWNPLIKSIKGEVKVGKKFEAQIGTMKFKPTVLVFEKERELTWLGRVLIPGIFDGKHTFQFIQNADGTTNMIQSEWFTGILVPFMKKKLNTEIKKDFEAMNAKLKELAEKA